jgi:hypothetical protein
MKASMGDLTFSWIFRRGTIGLTGERKAQFVRAASIESLITAG